MLPTVMLKPTFFKYSTRKNAEFKGAEKFAWSLKINDLIQSSQAWVYFVQLNSC